MRALFLVPMLGGPKALPVASTDSRCGAHAYTHARTHVDGIAYSESRNAVFPAS